MILPDTFQTLPRLKHLYLSNNRIRMIQSDTFQNVTSLQTLSLAFNRITYIHSQAFKNLPHIQKLYLQKNKLSAILPSAFRMLLSIRTVINVDGNPWQCDCMMAPFRLNTTNFQSLTDKIICSQPANVQGRKLTDVDPEDLIY
ncbi:PREDICTED: reticulon-4 receptor-like [Branchiostoma belcheri]|uniref:Reticulon-4 receptor-like n=1 Tax=Branchiostoma belcheri TaxID=7741 RepID=A0A6P4YN62_BRABE|nr:PREDICTED: reticulon-4 receptor-like [Branchiostoma belcheri]